MTGTAIWTSVSDTANQSMNSMVFMEQGKMTKKRNHHWDTTLGGFNPFLLRKQLLIRLLSGEWCCTVSFLSFVGFCKRMNYNVINVLKNKLSELTTRITMGY